MTKEVYEVYSEDLYKHCGERSGNFAKMKAKVAKKYIFSLDGTKEDRKPQPITIVRAGKTITVPTIYLTKTGKIKKSGLEYINMMLGGE
jgi:hypothetical protein